METIEFKFKGKEFKVTLNGIDQADNIEIVMPNDTNKYLYEFGHEVRMNKIHKYVFVRFKEDVWRADGSWLRGDSTEFQATGQETFTYFYNMFLGNLDDLGTTLDKMIIDGYLIGECDLPVGVFGNNGKFYKPTSFDVVIEENNITINLVDKFDEEYTYSIPQLGLSQTSNVFTDIPNGTYMIIATSPNSMPYYYSVEIAVEDIEEVL